jgi:hypothetical protein
MTMDRTHETTTTTPTARPAATRNRRRLVALGAAFAVAALGAGALVTGAGGGSDDQELTSVVPAPTTTALPDEPVEVVPAPAPSDVPVAQPVTPSPSKPAGQPAPQPAGDEEPADQPGPEEPQPAPGVLAVSKSLIELPEKTWAGTFQVRNDGGSPIDWQWAAGATGISVSHTSGTLQPGEFVEVAFSIDHTVLPAGDFVFANCVYTADQAKDVRIEGTKTIKTNPGIQLPNPVIKP